MDKTELDNLMQETLELHKEGKSQQAESLLRAALEKDDHPRIRRNLAQLVLAGGSPAMVHEILAPLINGEDFIAEMLAAQALFDQNRQEEGRRHLAAMECIIDQLFTQQDREPNTEEKHYAGILMQMLGSLGEHEHVLKMYKRWQHTAGDWSLQYLAAVAAFNLQYFREAAAFWEAIGKLPVILGMQKVAALAEAGAVPPFLLEYTFPENEVINTLIDESLAELKKEGIQYGLVRMAFLSMALNDQAGEDNIKKVLTPLILPQKEWDKKLGLSLFESPAVSKKIKIAVVQLLVETGVFPEGKPIPVSVDGTTIPIVVTMDKRKNQRR